MQLRINNPVSYRLIVLGSANRLGSLPKGSRKLKAEGVGTVKLNQMTTSGGSGAVRILALVCFLLFGVEGGYAMTGFFLALTRFYHNVPKIKLMLFGKTFSNSTDFLYYFIFHTL
jgi:hypothetical protein